ncbi:MAG: hypothetical protein ABW003_24755 [Microvirga sp.]|jgi:hypothetical protein
MTEETESVLGELRALRLDVAEVLPQLGRRSSLRERLTVEQVTGDGAR